MVLKKKVNSKNDQDKDSVFSVILSSQVLEHRRSEPTFLFITASLDDSSIFQYPVISYITCYILRIFT